MASLRLVVNLEMLSQGSPFRAKQGAAANAALDWLLTTVDGEIHERRGSVAASSAETLYDASQDDLPATFDALFFWSDKACHLQLIDINATGTNVIIPILALWPFILGDGDLLAAADETAITNDGTTLRPIDKVVVGNGSGAAANYLFAIIT